MRGGEQPAPPLADASGLRFAIVVSRFNEAITGRLRDAAVAALEEAGASRGAVSVVEVPGAFEIPQAARVLADTDRYDAVICLGCIIRGETPHFEYLASATAHGIMAASADSGVPMAFGVLTTETLEQAQARAADGPDNKGREAAAAAIEMARVFRTVVRTPPPPTGFRV